MSPEAPAASGGEAKLDAELIAVGSELLQPGFRDSNSSWLAGELAELGIVVRRTSIVGDDVERLAESMVRAWASAPVVLVTGGLGPTEDDRTRLALAGALGAALESDDDAQRAIVAYLAQRGRMADRDQLRQSLRPAGTRSLPNPVGIAPGILVERGGRILAALPGVPVEMREMFRASVVPLLAGRSARHLRRRILKVAGRTESSVDREVRDLYGAPGLTATILAKSTGIELVLQVEGGSAAEADRRLEEVDRSFAARLSGDLVGRDGETLATVIGAVLRASGTTLATAESCTAGMLGATITEVAGSSEWYRGGLIVYSNPSKISCAGVDAELLRREGAVSAQVASALASGARSRFAADFGVGITGIAGPAGGSVEKPVGLVFVGVAGRSGARAIEHHLGGGRDLIRRRSVTLALDLLRRELDATP